jgi:hypothetical protein
VGNQHAAPLNREQRHIHDSFFHSNRWHQSQQQVLQVKHAHIHACKQEPATSPQGALTDEENFAGEFGTKLSKLFLGVYLFIRYPKDTPSRLTDRRDIKLQGVQDDALKIRIGGTRMRQPAIRQNLGRGLPAPYWSLQPW